ncbi:MAG: hypothetical protein KC561_21460 [Myxococcales bacterium]|nr:hypothetical protein [Myxococcales bacterium]
MSTRPRFDLDGIPLKRPEKPGTLAVLRFRTTEGLVLLMPESADFLVPWNHLDDVHVDLKAGTVRVVFGEGYAESQNWLNGSRVLIGTWVDRVKLELDALGLDETLEKSA